MAVDSKQFCKKPKGTRSAYCAPIVSVCLLNKKRKKYCVKSNVNKSGGRASFPLYSACNMVEYFRFFSMLGQIWADMNGTSCKQVYEAVKLLRVISANDGVWSPLLDKRGLRVFCEAEWLISFQEK